MIIFSSGNTSTKTKPSPMLNEKWANKKTAYKHYNAQNKREFVLNERKWDARAGATKYMNNVEMKTATTESKRKIQVQIIKSLK